MKYAVFSLQLHVFFIRNKYIGKKCKHDAHIRQKMKKLRNTGRLSFKNKLERSVFARKFLIELETRCKQHLSVKCLQVKMDFSSHSFLVAIGNFKNFKKQLRLDFTKY